ncbi:MAG TPA: glycosyltransferase family 9 protein, partial [Terriglobales bacterium]|nr:glycosyltransferase family 9 protein [Terriglobales bacterium]
IAGLIHATRLAHAVIGVDSGPMHLAAALSKPGVAIFGPTDPARNGPFGGGPILVLRSQTSVTSHARRAAPEAGLLTIAVTDVLAAVATVLGSRA